MGSDWSALREFLVGVEDLLRVTELLVVGVRVLQGLRLPIHYVGVVL